MNVGDKVKFKDGGIRIGTIVDLKNDVAKVEFLEQGRLPARTESFYLSDLIEVSKAQSVSQELKEALYHVYNPQEEEEENLLESIKHNIMEAEGEETPFNVGDLVVYTSPNGSRYNCFAIISELNDYQATITALTKLDGSSNLQDIDEVKTVDLYSISPAKERLASKIEELRTNLENLEKIQKEL